MTRTISLAKKLRRILAIELLPVVLIIGLGLHSNFLGPAMAENSKDSLTESPRKERRITDSPLLSLQSRTDVSHQYPTQDAIGALDLPKDQKNPIAKTSRSSCTVPTLASLPGTNQTITTETVWSNEAHTISDNIIVKNGGNLTLDHSNLTLAGTVGTTNSSQYSSTAPYDDLYFYFRWQPDQRVLVRVSWTNNPTGDMIDAGIYSAQDFPNSTTSGPDSPPQFYSDKDLSGWALAKGGGSPENAIFTVPVDKGTLFFVAVHNFASQDNSGWANATDIIVPSVVVESGGTLNIAGGSRLNVSQIELAGAGVLLVQNGASVTIRDSKLDQFVTLEIEEASISIRNVTFQGQGAYTFINILGVSPVIANNSFIAGYYGIYINGTSSPIIRNNTFDACSRDAIRADYSDGVIIVNNTIRNSETRGLLLYCSPNCIMANNSMATVDLFMGIYVYNSSNAIIENNAVSDCNREGIAVQNSHNSLVFDNVLTDILTENGIVIRNSDNSIVYDNRISNVHTWSGIWVGETENSTFRENIICNTSWFGIHLDNSPNNTVTENILKNTTVFGICLGISSSSRVTSNIITNSSGFGINLWSSEDISVGHNAIANSSWAGIRVDTSNDSFIFGNTIKHSGNAGIFLNHSRICTVKANLITNSSYHGIDLWDSFSNTLTGNRITNSTWYGIYANATSGSNGIWGNSLESNAGGNAYDGSGTNQWDNGTHGNWWDDYTGSDTSPRDGFGDTPYPILGGAGAQDYRPLIEKPGVDTIPPFIDQLADVTHEAGISDHNLTWHPSEVNPDRYILSCNGTIIATDSWTGGLLSFSIEEVDLGLYNYTLLVNDTSGYWASSTVWVSIIDTTAPVIDQPADQTFEACTGEHILSWQAQDVHPNNYTLYRNGSTIDSGTWSSDPLSFTIGPLSLGVHNFTLAVNDTTGNSASDTVIVTIMDTTPPTITHPVDVTYPQGATGTTITWSPTDCYPASYSLYRNGAILKSGGWGGSTITIDVIEASPGTYNFTLVVTDAAGNSISDTVIVTVTSESLTTTPETSERESEEPSVSSPGFTVIGVLLFSLLAIVINQRQKRKGNL